MTISPTPLGAVARGLAAGVAGTACMTLAQGLAAKLQPPEEDAAEDRQDQGEQDPWEQASAPAQVGRRIIEGVFKQHVPAQRIPLLTHGMHWAYGVGWGAVFGLVQGTVRTRPIRNGVLFGSGVWVMAYVQLVPMGLYELPWKYSAKDLGTELSFHLVYGAGLGGAHRLIAARTR